MKLEFYRKGHSKQSGSPSEEQLPINTIFSDIGLDFPDTDLQINGDMAVQALENAFEKKLGLHVQIFRRSNALWLQTSATDQWSLDKQNTKGLHSVQNINT